MDSVYARADLLGEVTPSLGLEKGSLDELLSLVVLEEHSVEVLISLLHG